jgi:hypothetical protein
LIHVCLWQPHLCFKCRRTFKNKWLWHSGNFRTIMHIWLEWPKTNFGKIGIYKPSWRNYRINLRGA